MTVPQTFHRLCCGREGMHLRFICWSGNIPSHYFICPLRDQPSQDAEGIFSAIKKAFADEGLEHLLRNIVFLASDGASVNSGIKEGLISLIRKETPREGFVWWFAHRLELALKQTLKQWFEPITTCLMNLYYLYEKLS